MRSKFLYIVLFISSVSFGQEKDTTNYFTQFKEKIVLFSDIGYVSAPFRLVYPFTEETEKLKFRHNLRPVIGFGGAYKWFSLRIGIALKGTTRAESRFGKTSYFDLGTQFQVKKWFFDINVRSFKGYAIKNANEWNDTLNALTPNDIRSNTQSSTFSINSWYFLDENFKMTSVVGIKGHYEKGLGTYYVKPTFAIHGLNNASESLIPTELTDLNFDKTNAHNFTAVEIGAVPGYAYVNRINNWQFCAMLGLGGVIQAKSFTTQKVNRGFLGLSPRYDLKLYGGYSVPKYFAFLSLDFDNKSIQFTNLKYKQNYFMFRITAGVRLDKKDKKKE